MKDHRTSDSISMNIPEKRPWNVQDWHQLASTGRTGFQDLKPESRASSGSLLSDVKSGDRLKCHMKWGTELERMIINIITRYSVHIQHTYCV